MCAPVNPHFVKVLDTTPSVSFVHDEGKCIPSTQICSNVLHLFVNETTYHHYSEVFLMVCFLNFSFAMFSHTFEFRRLQMGVFSFKLLKYHLRSDSQDYETCKGSCMQIITSTNKTFQHIILDVFAMKQRMSFPQGNWKGLNMVIPWAFQGRKSIWWTKPAQLGRSCTYTGTIRVPRAPTAVPK